MGIKDLNKKYEINEIVRGDSIFLHNYIWRSINGIVKKRINMLQKQLHHDKSF